MFKRNIAIAGVIAVALFTGRLFFAKTGEENTTIALYSDRAWKSVVDHSSTTSKLADTAKKVTTTFDWGSQGWFRGWSDENLAKIQTELKVNSIRVGLGEQMFVDANSYDIKISTFKQYEAMGLKNLTAILYQPHYTHKGTTKYENCVNASFLFNNLYAPILNADGSVNKENYYAWYVYQTMKTYTPWVKYWEVWNEPDLNGGDDINGGPSKNGWLTRMPLASELQQNMSAPFTEYVRMLRITYVIASNFFRDDEICLGGIGYPNFLDALCRYSDNPDNGKITTDYPKAGIEYVTTIAYHIYPHYFLKKWGFKGLEGESSSDNAVKVVLAHADKLKAVLKKHSVAGKNFICTETGLSKRSVGPIAMSDEMQRNFGIKILCKAQIYGLKGLYFYVTGDYIDVPPTEAAIQDAQADKLMGLYENLTRDKYGFQKMTQLGKGLKTFGNLTSQYTYDLVATKALYQNASVDGIVMKNKGGKRLFILWAKTVIGNENTTVNCILPIATTRYEWDGSSSVAAKSVQLSGAPSFFVE